MTGGSARSPKHAEVIRHIHLNNTSYFSAPVNCRNIPIALKTSPTIPSLEHGCLRWSLPERRPATPPAARLGRSGESGQRRVLGESRPDGILMNTAASAVCITVALIEV
jgi:hypothetical protein